MFLKSIEVTDVYGNKVLVSGEEIIRAYEKVVYDYMEVRFFWIFNKVHEKFNKSDIKACARAATKRLTNKINFDLSPRNAISSLEKEVYSNFKYNEFYNPGE